MVWRPKARSPFVTNWNLGITGRIPEVKRRYHISEMYLGASVELHIVLSTPGHQLVSLPPVSGLFQWWVVSSAKISVWLLSGWACRLTAGRSCVWTQCGQLWILCVPPTVQRHVVWWVWHSCKCECFCPYIQSWNRLSKVYPATFPISAGISSSPSATLNRMSILENCCWMMA